MCTFDNLMAHVFSYHPVIVWQDQPPQRAYSEVCQKRKPPLATYMGAYMFDKIIVCVFSHHIVISWLPFFDTVMPTCSQSALS